MADPLGLCQVQVLRAQGLWLETAKTLAMNQRDDTNRCCGDFKTSYEHRGGIR